MTTPPDPFGPPSDSPYGSPPAQPGYGSQPSYEQPSYGQPAYGQPYGQQPYAPTPFGQPGGPQLASWGPRVLAALVDALIVLPVVIVGAILTVALGDVLGTLLMYAGIIALVGWNLVRQGNTGQTLGKSALGLRLLREVDGQPVGAGLSIGRYFVHVVDQIPCYLGYLWPLWDAKKQTFADKILKTVVIKA